MAPTFAANMHCPRSKITMFPSVSSELASGAHPWLGCTSTTLPARAWKPCHHHFGNVSASRTSSIAPPAAAQTANCFSQPQSFCHGGCCSWQSCMLHERQWQKAWAQSQVGPEFKCSSHVLHGQTSKRCQQIPVTLQAPSAMPSQVMLPIVPPKEAVAPCTTSSIAFPSSSCMTKDD